LGIYGWGFRLTVVMSRLWDTNQQLIDCRTREPTTRIWDVERGECVQTVIGHRAEVCCVQYSPDASLLASASSDMSVRMNDPRQRHRCIEVLEGHSNSVYSLSWRRGSGYGLLATASQVQT